MPGRVDHTSSNSNSNGAGSSSVGKVVLNIVVLGPADSGKSTTVSHLVVRLGNVDRRLLERCEREAAEMNKKGCKFAWVLDRLQAERERSCSIVTSRLWYETEQYYCNIIDAPGRRDYIDHMIRGIAQADVVLMVVDAGDDSHVKLCKEHAELAYCLGIRSLVVAVNKMDSVGWAEDRFEYTKQQLQPAITKMCNFNQINFIPISGWTGDNLADPSAQMPWYSGHTLIRALDLSDMPTRAKPHLPLRLCVQDVVKVGGIGTVCIGRVECGILRSGMRVGFCPEGLTATVKSVEVHHQVVEQAVPGDLVGFSITPLLPSDISRGSVCYAISPSPSISKSATPAAPRAVASFTAQIIVSHPNEVRVGFSPMLHVHTAHVACKIVRFVGLIDKKTGKVSGTPPDVLKKDDYAVVQIMPFKPICVEAAATAPAVSPTPSFSRIALLDSHITVARGVIKSVEYASASAAIRGGV